MTTFDITSFCSTEKGRTYICNPFNSGGFSVATNGHILVRVPAQEAYVGNEVPPNFEKATSGMDDPLVFTPLPPLNFELGPCSVCKGYGNTAECPECNGEGEHECCECGRSTECDYCHGKGYFAVGKVVEGATACEMCMGKGVLPVERYALLDPTSCYDIKYLMMIHALPGILVALRGDSVPMVFKFDGGMGMLMPVCLSVKAVKLYAEDAA
jgi:hypothetical protein